MMLHAKGGAEAVSVDCDCFRQEQVLGVRSAYAATHRDTTPQSPNCLWDKVPLGTLILATGDGDNDLT